MHRAGQKMMAAVLGLLLACDRSGPAPATTSPEIPPVDTPSAAHGHNAAVSPVVARRSQVMKEMQSKLQELGAGSAFSVNDEGQVTWANIQAGTINEEIARILIDQPQLRSLSTINCTITDEQLALLTPLKDKLESLSLSHRGMTDRGMATVAEFVKLRTLSLPEEITDVGFAQIKGLVNLVELSLADTQVSDASLQILKGFTNLKKLNLVGSRCTPAGADELRDALPDCKIVDPDL